MDSMNHRMLLMAAVLLGLAPAAGQAQINFTKTDYYVAMGDSVAAGEGAMPVTIGYACRLYDEGLFAPKQQMDLSSVAIRGARTWEFRDHQMAAGSTSCCACCFRRSTCRPGRGSSWSISTTRPSGARVWS